MERIRTGLLTVIAITAYMLMALAPAFALARP